MAIPQWLRYLGRLRTEPPPEAAQPGQGTAAPPHPPDPASPPNHRAAEETREGAVAMSSQLMAVLDTVGEGIVVVDEAGLIMLVNHAAEQIWGYEEAGLIGQPVSVLMPARHRAAHEAGFQRYLTTGESKIIGRRIEMDGLRSNETLFPLEISIAETSVEGRRIFTAAVRDITERKEAEQRLLREAFFDPLTGLPNRALFMDRLQTAIAHAKRTERTGALALLFLDLDSFKVVNDSLGHGKGDDLLVQTSRRIVASLRPADTVARVGGDEFAMILYDLDHLDECEAAANRVLAALREPFRIGSHEVFVSASIGISIYDSGYRKPEEMLRDADTAMYRAKARGKGAYEVFHKSMHERALVRLRVETDLRRAVERGELQVVYQPVMSLVSGRIAGFEALARWRHPKYRNIPTGEFISLAEEIGVITPIGEWVLREACARLRDWRARFPLARPLHMAVNVSSRQLIHGDFARHVARLLEEIGVAPEALKLEITESVLMENLEVARAVLTALHDWRIGLSLDDFGTGYSSLSYLHQFPIGTLKIDRSFVQNMAESGKNVEIVRAIMSLAHCLGKDVVAEGIETIGQQEIITDMGCGYGQGFLFARPLDVEAAEAFLANSSLEEQGAASEPGKSNDQTIGR